MYLCSLLYITLIKRLVLSGSSQPACPHMGLAAVVMARPQVH
jgi:hypothetical protein